MTTFGISPDRPLKYTGSPLALVPTVKAPRAPTVNDKNWPVMTLWNDDATSDIYCLTHFDSGDAIWELFISSSASAVNTLTSDSGVATAASNNINTFGDATQGISSSATGDTVTWTIADATDTQKGVAKFDGTDFVVTNGTVTLASTPTAIDYITDSGTATETGGELNVLGGTNIATTGSGNTVTVNFEGVLPVASGGTGQSSFTDGQLLIGNTSGNTLTKATLTAGTGIDITNGNGSITIDANAAVPTTFTTDSGTATPVLNNLNVLGVNGIATSAVGDDLFIDGSGISNNLLINDFEKTVVYVCDMFNLYDTGHDTGYNTVSTNNPDYRDTYVTKDHPGVLLFGGAGGVVLGENDNSNKNIKIGGGQITTELWLRTIQAPTAGKIRFGLSNTNSSSTTPTDEVTIVIDNFGASSQFVARTSKSSTSTSTSLGTNLSSSWVKLGIIINADATSVGFYINNSLVATHTTNIPLTTQGLFNQFICGTGTTGSTEPKPIAVDIIQIIIELNGERNA